LINQEKEEKEFTLRLNHQQIKELKTIETLTMGRENNMKLTDIILEDVKGDIKSISLSYTDPGGRLYSISIDGEKQRSVQAEEAAINLIKNMTGLEVPRYASYDDEEVSKVIDALKAEGIEATVYPMDVS